MQPQFILATLLSGFAAASMILSEPVNNTPGFYCEKGQGKPQAGPLCIGTNGESFGPAKECEEPACSRFGRCKIVTDDNGCRVCGPHC
ncbi:hypothetical protein MY11210_004318 [Beauveria gryllotalpidicola]